MKITKKATSAVLCGALLLQIFCATGMVTATAQTVHYSSIQNGDFETPVCTILTTFEKEDVARTGWQTTASDGMIEFVRPSADLITSQSEYNTTEPSKGDQFAELDAHEVSSLYQDILSCEGEKLYWGLDHRGRWGTDVMAVVTGPSQENYTHSKNANSPDGYTIAVRWLLKTAGRLNEGDNNAYTVFAKDFDSEIKESNADNYFSMQKSDDKPNKFKVCIISDNNNGWDRYYGSYNVADDTDDGVYNKQIVRMAFVSVSAASQRNSVGNLIDNVEFSAQLPKEATPKPVFDQCSNQIGNLMADTQYNVTLDGKTSTIVTDENGCTPVADEWKEQQLLLVKPGQQIGDFKTLDSDAAPVDVYYNYKIKLQYIDGSVKTDGAYFCVKSGNDVADNLTSYSSAKENNTVTVTVPSDYVGSVTAKKADGTNINVSHKEFTMPASDVTIYVNLTAKKAQGAFKYFTEYSFNEPWSVNMFTYGNGLTTENTSVYVLKSKDAVDNITADYVMEYGSDYRCSKQKTVDGKNLIGCYYTDHIYTYELEYHLYVVFTAKDSSGNITYSSVKDRKAADFFNKTISSNASNIYGETKKVKATAVCKSVMEMYNAVLNTISRNGAVKPGYPQNGMEVRYSALKNVSSVQTSDSLFKNHTQDMRVIEPWGVVVGCDADVADAVDYGVIIYNCRYNNLTTTDYGRINIPSAEYLLSRETTKVYSAKDGNIDYSDGRISATFTDGVYAGTLDSDIVYAFFVESADGTITFENLQYFNMYELADKLTKTSPDGVLFKSMMNVYDKLFDYNK